jgi:hypothetical protein
MSKRSEPQGIQTSLYLTAKRQQILSRFHKDFRQAVYKLIDQAGEASEDAPKPPISPAKAPKDALDALDKPAAPKVAVANRCQRVRCPGCAKCGGKFA